LGELKLPDVRKEVESLLFASGRAMLEKDLIDIIGARPSDVKKALAALKDDYEKRDTSLTLMDTGQGWKMNVKEKYATLVTKIVADTELSFPLLETLSVIAFRAPAVQAEIIKTRGTNAYEHIQQLIDAGFIERIKKGRSFDLGLMPKFFEYFDVEGEKSLKMLLKDVKASEPKKRKGEAEAVPPQQQTLPTGAEAVWNPKPAGQVQDPNVPATVEGLAVVNIPEHPKKKAEQFQPDTDFLSAMEAKLGDLSKRNDAHDEDELFAKKDLTPENATADDEFVPPENTRTKEIFGEEDDTPLVKEEGSEEESPEDKS
jgi:segregation and condensation protein B